MTDTKVRILLPADFHIDGEELVIDVPEGGITLKAAHESRKPGTLVARSKPYDIRLSEGGVQVK